ncbi:hypothetical protein [Luteolibacter luteus]|uniref:CHAP domain-containing protein n=1 Tax=Luteolibacter luteus TaxID=2728835 RepID=A0A858RN56_9BACT|nr:hypothetical protein [Luteolibacter luteus]QJE98302.1 hypothetical protein HHL09_21805 [Luteolibacter luteus]
MPTIQIHRSFLRAILALGAIAELHAVQPLQAADAPLQEEAKHQFETMKSTFYQYRTEVNRETGSYRYDCVGFVSYCLRVKTPEAWATVFKETGIGKGRIPSPPKYQVFFAKLPEQPQPGWQAVPKASDLKAGDIVAWEHKTTSAVGHAVILAGDPLKQGDGSWKVEVFDSTGSPHTDDSRPEDERAQRLPSGKRSGLGRGVMVLIADPETGALTGLRWSLKADAVMVPIAAGRPVS